MTAAYVIVGAGQAGAWIARTLRSSGCDARIVLIGEEDAAPYERPPLSKAVLKGEAPPASATLLDRDAAAALGVELWLGETVQAVDRAAHRVRCASGREIEYARLFLATGSRVRTLPTPGLPEDRVFYLRTLRDAERLRAAMAQARRVLVVGGGWVGLEVAATARGLGKDVALVEMAPRLCARAVPAAVSDALLDLHRGHGVDVRTAVAAALAWNGSAIEATTDDGRPPIVADLAVIGVGIVPNVELAADCGLAVDDGIVVDAAGRTSDPDIFAAGDVTNQPNRHCGARVRLESWANAQDQAVVAARAALGGEDASDEIPWFWSDQFDVNLQILGLPPAGVEPARRGDPADGQCMWFFWRGRRIASVIGINAPRDVKVVKKWMREDRFPEPAAVLDPGAVLQRLPRVAPEG